MKCNISVFPGLHFNIFSVFHAKTPLIPLEFEHFDVISTVDKRTDHGKLYLNSSSGLDVATCGVANATSFYSVATKFSRLVANLAPKIGDSLLWENVH